MTEIPKIKADPLQRRGSKRKDSFKTLPVWDSSRPEDRLTWEDYTNIIASKIGRSGFARGYGNTVLDDHSGITFDDLKQEGYIQLWRDLNSGTDYTNAHLINRAVTRARAVATSGHHPQFGRVGGRASAGHRHTEDYVKQLEKVDLYFKEYVALHGKRPQLTHAGKSLGLSFTQMKQAVKNIDAGGLKNLHYGTVQESGRVRTDKRLFSMNSLEGMRESVNSTGSNDRTFPWEAAQTDEASGLVDSLAIRDVMKKHLSDRHRAVLYGYFWEEKSQTEVGCSLRISQMQVSRDIKQALKILKKHLDPSD